MRCVAPRTELLDMYLGLLCFKSTLVCLHPPYHPMLPFSDGPNWNGFEGLWHILLQGCEGVITVCP